MVSRRNSMGPASILSGDDDLRFSDLLKPIKDLTENWQVPLAKLLDDYYDELHDLQISVDGQTSHVNFTEAAFLLQGTASVYSKKVEFLWQSVLKMLELLASKKALDEVETGPKRAKKSAIGDPNNFSLVDIELVYNIDLKTDAAGSSATSTQMTQNDNKTKEIHAKKMSLKFIFVTPRQLIEKDGLEDKKTRVRLNVKAGNKWDQLGFKDDFRVNSQYAMTTGMIGEDLSAESELGQQSVSLCNDSNNENVSMDFARTAFADYNINSSTLNTSHSVPRQQREVSSKSVPDVPQVHGRLDEVVDEAAATATEDEDDGQDNLSGFFFGFDDPDDPLSVGPAPLDALPEVMTDDDQLPANNNNIIPSGQLLQEDDEVVKQDMGRRRKDKLAELVNEPRAPLADAWEPIQPHESAAAIPKKKKRKGRTSRAPAPNVELLRKTSTRSRRKETDPDAAAVPPVETFVAEVMARGSANTAVAAASESLPPEAEREIHQMLKENRRKTGAWRNKDSEHDGKDGAQDHPNDEDDDGWTDAQFDVDDGHDEDDFDDAGMPQTAHALDSQQMPASQSTAATQGKDVDSYEDLVMKRVAAYVAQSQDYIESTDLAKRVRNWHESIAHKLEEVERRGDFDVHDYGTKILDHFDASSESVNASSAKSRKSTYNFAELVVGKKKEEVARLFLSSLMLANTYNIELTVDPDKSNQSPLSSFLPMDNVQMTLLTKTRHHQQLLDMDYQHLPPPPPTDDEPSSSHAHREHPGQETKKKKSKKKAEPAAGPSSISNGCQALPGPSEDGGHGLAPNCSTLVPEYVTSSSKNKKFGDAVFKVPNSRSTSKSATKKKNI